MAWWLLSCWLRTHGLNRLWRWTRTDVRGTAFAICWITEVPSETGPTGSHAALRWLDTGCTRVCFSSCSAMPGSAFPELASQPPLGLRLLGGRFRPVRKQRRHLRGDPRLRIACQPCGSVACPPVARGRGRRVHISARRVRSSHPRRLGSAQRTRFTGASLGARTHPAERGGRANSAHPAATG